MQLMLSTVSRYHIFLPQQRILSSPMTNHLPFREDVHSRQIAAKLQGVAGSGTRSIKYLDFSERYWHTASIRRAIARLFLSTEGQTGTTVWALPLDTPCRMNGSET
jgi:hypothetical protein